MKPMDVRMFKENLNLFPYQKLYFSRYLYGHLVAVFPDKVTSIPRLERMTGDDTILVVSGVANPRPFVRHIRQYQARVNIQRYPDHATYAAADMEAILRKFSTMSGKRKHIITTEKDAVKLAHNPYFPHELKEHIFYLPVSVDFLPNPIHGTKSPEDFDTVLRHKIEHPEALKQ